MRFTETKIPGSFLIDVQKLGDDRGFFARAWCQQEFEEHGLVSRVVQANLGFSPRRGTLRGLHYQLPPFEEVKVVRCTRGAVFDVIVDLRPGSPAYQQWVGTELTADNHRTFYVPAGCAHGYLTLSEDAEIFYQTSHAFVPDAARGVRYDDPVLGIEWPAAIEVVSDKDRAWPLLDRPEAGVGLTAIGGESA
jgi:dTDP-4-dehydrorhamnose 3,5-epimerase